MSFASHLSRVLRDIERALELGAEQGESFDGVVFHSGLQRHYAPRDRPVPFLGQPHFLRLCPAEEPELWLRCQPGRKPRIARAVERGYWDDPAPTWPAAWLEAFDVVDVADPARALAALGDVSGMAFVGESAAARAAGVDATACNPGALLAALAWARSHKTPYEIERIREAGARAAQGHGVVARLARQGRSERALHAAFLAASDQLEHDTPYTNIIAWDAHAATLHYAAKRSDPPEPGHVLLIDAGARCGGYASDITRTYALPGAHPLFAQLLEGMRRLQRALVAAIAPGVEFVALHRQAERGVCELLCEAGVLRCAPTEAIEAGLAGTFLPHGLGHMLGLEVHDVAGRQRDARGQLEPPPADAPHLRTTRALAPGNVVTIEPGLYFIPSLLQELRASARAALVDWALVEQLAPSGGIRIEDDVRVTDEGHEDLTAEAVARALITHEARGPEPDQPGYR